MLIRCVVNPPGNDPVPENPIQLAAGSVAGVILDADESYVHGVLISYVPLGQGDTL